MNKLQKAIVSAVLDKNMTILATAQRFGVSRSTVRNYLDLFEKERLSRSRLQDRAEVVRSDLRKFIEEGLRAGYPFGADDLRAFEAVTDRLYKIESGK
jgi:transposase